MVDKKADEAEKALHALHCHVNPAYSNCCWLHSLDGQTDKTDCL